MARCCCGLTHPCLPRNFRKRPPSAMKKPLGRLSDVAGPVTRHRGCVLSSRNSTVATAAAVVATERARRAAGDSGFDSVQPGGRCSRIRVSESLRVADFATKSVRRLTHDGSKTVPIGKTDGVYFEEVYGRRWKAWKWSCDGRQIAFQRFDDRIVPVFQISARYTREQAFEREHDPHAGQTNPQMKRGVVSREEGRTSWLAESRPGATEPLTGFFRVPNSGQLVRCEQDRAQTYREDPRDLVSVCDWPAAHSDRVAGG